MKIITGLLFFIMSISTQAQGLYLNDMNAMAYVKISFDKGYSSKSDDSVKLGLTVNRTYTSGGKSSVANLNTYNDFNQSSVDIEYSSKTNYFSRFKLGGVDSLNYRYVLNADGTASKESTGISTTLIVIGVVAAVVGIALIASNSGVEDDCKTCPLPF